MITVCIPTIKRFDLLEQAVWSFKQDPMVWGDILVMDNSGGKCPKIRGANIVVPEEPLSVAASWNWFYKNTDEYTEIMIANDDIEIDEFSVTKMVKESQLGNQVGIFFGNEIERVNNDNNYSFFMLRREVYLGVGAFDENFKPAYYEDCDYSRRMALLGVRTRISPGARYYHQKSATMKTYDEEEMKIHHKNMRLNQSYYMGKWGGLPGKEKYDVPFNGRRP